MGIEDASEDLWRRTRYAIKPSDMMVLSFKENVQMTSPLADLSDAQLLDSLKGLVARGRAGAAQVLVHLAEVEHRQLHLAAAYASMHAYTTRHLGFSDSEAYDRVHAARAARKVPAILDMVADGRLHLTAVRLLAPHLVPDDPLELLTAAAHKTKRQILQLLADRAPKPDAPERVRRLPSPRPKPDAGQQDLLAVASADPPQPPPQPAARPEPPRPRPSEPQPLGADRYQVQFTASAALVGKLAELRALLSHREPGCNIATAIERAVDTLRADLLKERFAVGAKPKKSPTGTKKSRARTRHVPADVRREVVARDGLRCAFVDPETGRRCGSDQRLELEHHVPFARGGAHDASAMSLYCRAHNAFTARRAFGAEQMALCIAERQTTSTNQAPRRARSADSCRNES